MNGKFKRENAVVQCAPNEREPLDDGLGEEPQKDRNSHTWRWLFLVLGGRV